MKVLIVLVCMFLCNNCNANVAILTYHEVDNMLDKNGNKDVWAVSSRNFEKHIQYLQNEGYKFVSLNEYIEYCQGKIDLPEKSIMISFDDGYESFYVKVLPVLKKYDVPAMLAIVSSWLEKDKKPVELHNMATWEQLRDMEMSGLVTVVSHTDSLHVQRVINPQGGKGSCIENRLYLNNRYETDDEYFQRIGNDLHRVQELFKEKLGHGALAVVWPYGRYSGRAVDIALQKGFEGTFLLDGGINKGTKDDLKYAKRIIIYDNPDVTELKEILRTNDSVMDEFMLAQIDLDKIYDTRSEILADNVNNLINRLHENKVKVVALQAFADDKGDGNVTQVYFANSVVPVKDDVFNFVSNQLSQSGIKVFAWMPTLAINNLINNNRTNLVVAEPENNLGWYERVSPFDKDAEAKLKKIYKELSEYSNFDGILFQDDLYLNDFEDWSLPARIAYKQEFGMEMDSNLKADEKKMWMWSRFKTARLLALSQDLINAVKENRPEVYTARNIYTAVVENEDAEQWFAQNMKNYLETYDFTVLMAYDHMEKRVKDYGAFFNNLIQQTRKYKNGIEKTIFKIQTVDWENNSWIDKQHLEAEIKLLKQAGVKHIGYYPDTVYIFNKK